MKNELSLDINDQNLRTQCTRWKARAVHLCGTSLVCERDETTGMPTGKYVKQPMAEAVQGFFSRMLEGLNDPESIAQRNEFFQRAALDKGVMQQLAALRIESFQNYVVAHQNIIPFFFEQVSLGPEDRPVAVNNTTQEIRVRAIGQDNSARRVRIVKPQEEELIPLIWISTDEVEYSVVDIYNGNVVSAALATIRLAYDMANEREKRCFELLNTSSIFKTTFDTTNSSKVLRNYVANSRINVANLPTGNDIVVEGTTAESNFRPRVLLEASRYADRWTNSFADGPLVPTGRILIPAGDIAALGEEVSITTPSNPLVDQILTQGYSRIDYNGRTWTLVPDNTLTPGVAYIEFNRKIGRVYTKPALDKEIIDDSIAMQKKNREARSMKAVFGAYINVSQLPFVARFTYRTAP